MASNRTVATAAYALLAATDTYLASRSGVGPTRLRRVTKPLLMPTLALASAPAAVNLSGTGTRALRTGTQAAQAFSCGGDVALLGSSEKSFLAGVGSFAAAHAGYIAGFASVRDRSPAVPLSRRRGLRAAAALWLATAPAMSYAAGRKDPMLRLPVLGYATILSAMFATSTVLDPTLGAAARRRISLGTSLFLMSDSLLGLQEFVLDRRDSRLEAAVMGTYTAGQWFIADGVRRATTRH